MLKIVEKLRDLDCAQLRAVYAEHWNTGAAHDTESAFWDDLTLYYSVPGNVCCLWAPQGRYTACVRVEPYRDGFLMTCLETAPDCRRQGFAFALVTAVTDYLAQRDGQCVYVHVAKNNLPSIDLHKKAGFQMLSDSARLIDGTVSQKYVTMGVDLE